MRTLKLFTVLALVGCASSSQAPRPDTKAQPETAVAPPAGATAARATTIEPRPFRPTPALETVLLADPQKPIITFRFVFRAGGVDDPAGKEGLTALTADL